MQIFKRTIGIAFGTLGLILLCIGVYAVIHGSYIAIVLIFTGLALAIASIELVKGGSIRQFIDDFTLWS